ncbi:MAG: acyltransferase family protein [Bacillus sp. (in: firmicutes)]
MDQRTPYFDNAKFILIFFVVFGHLLRTFIHEHEIIYAVYKTIYSFHMPAFILISGFFAKGIYERGYIGKLFKKLIVPYFIFQAIYTVFYYYLRSKNSFELDMLTPHWSLWFLLSLFFWNIMLLLFSKFRPLVGITIALAFGLIVGFFDEISNTLSLSRTFVFFPMFLAGFHLKMDHLKQLMTPKARFISVLLFTLTFVGFYQMPEIDYKWLLGSKPYSELLATSLTGMSIRLGFYVLSFIMIACFLSCVPTERYFFTSLGKRTLYIYLLHGFFIQLFRESGYADYFDDPENYILLIGVTIILTFLLSSQFIVSIAQPFIELNTTRTKTLYMRIKIMTSYLISRKPERIKQSRP